MPGYSAIRSRKTGDVNDTVAWNNTESPSGSSRLTVVDRTWTSSCGALLIVGTAVSSGSATPSSSGGTAAADTIDKLDLLEELGLDGLSESEG